MTTFFAWPKRLLTIGALLAQSACASAPTGSQMSAEQLRAAHPGRLVIIGGGLSRENEAVYRAIISAKQGSGPICIFPTAAATPDSGMAGSVATFERYGGAGTAKGILVAEGRPETARDPAVASQIRSCSGFFFVGGVQQRVVNAFRQNNASTPALDALLERYRAGAVISGSSAGAAVMSDPMIGGGTSISAMTGGVRRARVANTTGDEEEAGGSGVSITPGIGFMRGALVDQHFLARGRVGRLIVAIDELAEYDLGFGIDENTALVVDGSVVYPVGASGVVVLDARNAQRSGRNIRGIQLHLLGADDRFDLARRTVALAGDKAALPAGARVTPPADVYARWAFLHLLHQFAASPETEVSAPFEGGRLILRKAGGFAARSRTGAGVQNTPAGLAVVGLTLDLERN